MRTCTELDILGHEWKNMATKLYVGNLADSTTEKSLRELFDAFGPVSEVAVLQGFGFVVS